MPTFDKPHLLLRWHGYFGLTDQSQVEEWLASVRLDIGSPGSWTEAQKADFLTAVKTPSQTFHNHTDVSAGGTCWLTELTAAYIGMDGRYMGGVDQETTKLATTPTAGSGPSTMPWDVAQAITLRTSQGRGRGHVGRFYWPCTSPVDNSGLWSVNKANQTSAQAATLLAALNTAAATTWGGPALGVSVFSGLDGGVHYPVVRVEVGRAPDTQRRRTKSLVEDWRGTNLPGSLQILEDRRARVIQ